MNPKVKRQPAKAYQHGRLALAAILTCMLPWALCSCGLKYSAASQGAHRPNVTTRDSFTTYPPGISINHVTYDSLELDMSADDGAVCYWIYRDDEMIAGMETNGAASSYSDAGLQPSTWYEYGVCATTDSTQPSDDYHPMYYIDVQTDSEPWGSPMRNAGQPGARDKASQTSPSQPLTTITGVRLQRDDTSATLRWTISKNDLPQTTTTKYNVSMTTYPLYWIYSDKPVSADHIEPYVLQTNDLDPPSDNHWGRTGNEYHYILGNSSVKASKISPGTIYNFHVILGKEVVLTDGSITTKTLIAHRHGTGRIIKTKTRMQSWWDHFIRLFGYYKGDD